MDETGTEDNTEEVAELVVEPDSSAEKMPVDEDDGQPLLIEGIPVEVTKSEGGIDIAAAFAEAGGEQVPETEEERAEREETAAQVPPPEPLVVETGFYVYLRADGRWIADSDAVSRPMVVARSANYNDFYLAAMTIQKDVMVAEVAGETVRAQQMAAAHIAQQVQAQAIAERLAQEGGALGLPGMAGVPGMGNRQQRRHRG